MQAWVRIDGFWQPHDGLAPPNVTMIVRKPEGFIYRIGGNDSRRAPLGVGLVDSFYAALAAAEKEIGHTGPLKHCEGNVIWYLNWLLPR